ncbi:TonB-dependent receptor [Sphingomonas gilva]|uniref:TonB-dependent receptor n=2 Tax=Sphingomonas gilva TaxID=2305907 RepID=A0A396RWU0_9SPHN|nr:TonB-dependent receptor [Sphingomonas gilva]
MVSVAAIVAMSVASPAMAQTRSFNVPAQAASQGIPAFAQQAGLQIVADGSVVQGKRTNAVVGDLPVDEALRRLLSGTGLIVSGDVNANGIIIIVAAPQVQSEASPIQSEPRSDDIIVTAQKRVESIQDVPIAITALSSEDLNEQKIEGGPDIMRAVPNLTFSKSNFTSYNVSIRGIGTKAVSASTDPGVAVSFNNTALIHNRFFEQEFFDLERVEVLRGPQGTLYGRNATGGVINLISAKPDLDEFEGSIKGEVGNFNSRRMVAMLNVPLFTDQLGLRVAGAMTQRDGYDYNSVTGNRINGRDLWSLRTTLGFEPTSWFRGNVIWERFREDDNRSRTGKQLCHRDGSPDMIGSTPTRQTNPGPSSVRFQEARAALFSTGCKAGSLYDDDAFGTPNGLALAYVSGAITANNNTFAGYAPDSAGVFRPANIVDPMTDPYGGMMQSRNLREVASIRDPRYRASSDILELNLDIDLSDGLTLSSQTAYNWDEVYSFQDYNRFNTVPIFNDTSNWVTFPGTLGRPSQFRDMAPNGVFCDPQIGCSDRLAVFDVSSAVSKQFVQEVRLQSDFDGPFNFSIGGNYTRFKTQNDYYVMSNLLTVLAMMPPFNYSGNQTTCSQAAWNDFSNGGAQNPIRDSLCPYIDPNPVESIDGDGHNYFRSSNPYELKSYAAFGEFYYNINPDLKLTGGLRYTRDEKQFTLVPSQLLLAPTMLAGGRIGTGYPALGDVNLKWGEFTGRFGIDWKPDLGFTDQTLLYATYSRGYKAGGVNPPVPDFPSGEDLLEYGAISQELYDQYSALGFFPLLELTAVNYGQTFEPEFVNAFEIGMKNSMMGGRLTLNASAFYYDYSNYQVSQIRDRTAVNENFDAKIWGAELSALFEPVDRLRFNANVGYLKTRIGNGERSIDPMNRNLGDANYTVFKPWVQLPSNCVVPTAIAEAWLQQTAPPRAPFGSVGEVCGGLGGLQGVLNALLIDPSTGQAYDPANYPELNGGAGLHTDLSGNELPNSPRWTVNLGAEYTIPFDGDWSATIRGDGYWQAKSWARVYNLDPYDRLRNWSNFNLSLRVEGPDDLAIEAYVKNLFDSTPITDAFLNSDDSGLTTNVFVLDPRIIGFSISKAF